MAGPSVEAFRDKLIRAAITKYPTIYDALLWLKRRVPKFSEYNARMGDGVASVPGIDARWPTADASLDKDGRYAPEIGIGGDYAWAQEWVHRKLGWDGTSISALVDDPKFEGPRFERLQSLENRTCRELFWRELIAARPHLLDELGRLNGADSDLLPSSEFKLKWGITPDRLRKAFGAKRLTTRQKIGREWAYSIAEAKNAFGSHEFEGAE